MRSQVFARVTVAMSLMLAVALLVAGGMAPTQVQAHQFTARSAETPALAALPTNGSLFFASLRDGPQEIYRYDFASSTVKRITTGGVNESFPSASPDGTRVCFESYRTANYEIFCADRDGNNPVNLTNDPGQDGMPRFSPDGTLIAYHRWAVGTSGFQIWVMNADGSNKRQLTFETGYMGEPAWFPSGTKLVFDGDKPDRNLLTINLDGTGLTVLNNQPGEQRSPSVGPDGSIYYDSSQTGVFQIYRMNTDGSNQTMLTSSGQNFLPHLSSDGTLVGFVSTRDAGDQEIYIANADGTGQLRITTNAGVDSVPVWANTPATSTCTPELVTVPFVNGPNGVASRQTYTGVVTLTVTGTGQAAGGQYSDAFYLYAAANGTAITPQHYTVLYNWVFWINNQHAENLIPGAQVPAYRADHAYSFPMNASGGTLSFGVGDTATSDNAGSYNVAICRATASTYAVSGRVTDSSSTPLAGVVVADGTRSATTGSDGSYTLSAVPAGRYTLTPSKSGYSFTPTSLSVMVAGNLSGQDFVGTAQVYSVSGHIVDSSGKALAGVTVTDGTRTATTDGTGTYLLSAVPAGSYTLTPTKSGYSFSAATRTVTVTDNLSGQDFTGTAQVYSVSGHIVDSSGNALAGVTVTDGTRTATTDSTGAYLLSAVPAGSYMLTPTKSGYSFSAATRTVTVTSNLSGQDFTGTLIETGGSWTFILYLDGDTDSLDRGFVYLFLSDAIQRLESNPNALVHVVALLDGPSNGDTRRVTFTPQAQYQLLGEKPMDDPTTLSEFVLQAQQDFPADHYYLAITDHANGVQGIAWDTTTASDRTALLTPAKLRQAFSAITNNGARPLDVVHFDGCSFGLLENAAMTQGFAHYVVASENIGWGVFAYDRYRATVGASTTPASLAKSIVEQYAQAVGSYPHTISALDMSRFTAALTGFNTFADRLITFAKESEANAALLVSVRTASQKFDSGGQPYLTINDDDTYVDLVDFAQRTQQQIPSAGVPTAAGDLIAAISGNQPLVLAERHQSGTFEQDGKQYTWNLDGAHGVSVYYPRRSTGTLLDYVTGRIFPEFTNLSHWKDYLRVGVPPLLPGEVSPNDPPEPLAHLLFLSRHTVYLPMLQR